MSINLDEFEEPKDVSVERILVLVRAGLFLDFWGIF